MQHHFFDEAAPGDLLIEKLPHKRFHKSAPCRSCRIVMLDFCAPAVFILPPIRARIQPRRPTAAAHGPAVVDRSAVRSCY
jgi:hypothetical protein